MSVAASKQRVEARAKDDRTNDCMRDRVTARALPALVSLPLLPFAVTATPSLPFPWPVTIACN
jgi:hypothetical protein